jgi:XTP/dITP diphosphohydrolase
MQLVSLPTKNKIKEIQQILPQSITILSLEDIGCHEEIPKLEYNWRKCYSESQLCNTKYGYDCFADDTGLEVEALNGEPGVYSARYAGEQCDSKQHE